MSLQISMGACTKPQYDLVHEPLKTCTQNVIINPSLYLFTSVSGLQVITVQFYTGKEQIQLLLL